MLSNHQVHPEDLLVSHPVVTGSTSPPPQQTANLVMSPPSSSSTTYQHQPLLSSTPSSSSSSNIEGNLFRGKTLDFFLQMSILLKDFLLTSETRALQEVQGYLILLSTDIDINLKIATLLDGTSIDFLFGSTLTQASRIFNNLQKTKVHEIKQFIRQLSFLHQEYIANFYHHVYEVLYVYLQEQEHICGCFWQKSFEDKLVLHIQQHFQHLQQQLRRVHVTPTVKIIT